MRLNDLSMEIYPHGSTTPVYGLQQQLHRAEGIQYSTGYPGGLFLDGSFYLPRKALDAWEAYKNYRIAIFNGLKCVYEGKIEGVSTEAGAVEQGVLVDLAGYWGAGANKDRWRKIWADNRLDDNTWPIQLAAQNDKFTVDRQNRIMIIPKSEAFVANENIRVIYTMPTGETIKRITYNFDFQEAAQAWQLRLYNTAASAEEWSVTASATGSQDITLATPSQTIFFQMLSLASQTPSSDGTIYGKVTDLMVYSETGNINLTEICTDIVGGFSSLFNSSTEYIGSNTLALAPFYSDNWETLAEIAEQAAAFGDSSYNAWAVGCLDSYKAATPAGLPVFYCEQQPLLTSHDYAVRLDDKNLEAPCGLLFDIGNVWNWIVVQYTDETGKVQYISPDDDANLTDATSVANYGTRAALIQARTASSTTATSQGRKYLAQYKDPKYLMTSSLKVKGYIRGTGNEIVPACQIRAGKRVRVENFLQDLSGSGLTFLVTKTAYNNDDETCTIETSQPWQLPILLADWVPTPRVPTDSGILRGK